MPRQLRTDAGWYRADITGLRSLAIVPVVAFHAGISLVPGGFVGVDMFYAISGFLITTLLVKEIAKTGRIAFGAFWAKRIRRLVPVLTLVVAVTLPVSLLFSSVLGWDSLSADGIASVFYLSNFLYWRQSTSYFSEAASLNPLLHTWSLSVEEQFYLVWPVVIVVVWFLARRLKRLSPNTALITVLATIFVSSLAFSIFLTPREPSAAFYLLPTRAWEFAAGGLLAVSPLRSLLNRRWATLGVGAIGAAAIIWSLISIHDNQPFPGSIAAIPVLGTLLVIASGQPLAGGQAFNPLTRLLMTRPFVWLGNVSYSWYLWHWPFIVIVVAAFGTQAWWIKAAAALASLGVAALTHRYVEVRLRYNAAVTRSDLRTYALGGAAAVGVSILAIGIIGAGYAISRSEPIKTYASAASQLPDQTCESESISAGGLPICKMGAVGSPTVVMLVGDSHAGQWKAAMSDAATARGLELVVRWKNACPAVIVNVADDLSLPDPECQQFQRDTSELISEIHPTAVVVSDAFGYIGKTRDSQGRAISTADQITIWRSAYQDFFDGISNAGSTVALVDDNPRIPFDPMECLTTLGGTPESCSVSPSIARADIRQIASIQSEAAQRDGITHIFSVGSEICNDSRCLVVSKTGVPVFLDNTHLANVWTHQFVPRLEQWFASIVKN